MKKPTRDGVGIGRKPTPLMGMGRRGRGMPGPPPGMMMGMRV